MVISCVIAVMMLYQGPVYRIIGIDKGTSNKMMLSLPMQQMAYAYNFGQDQLSESQLSKMRKYLTDEEWRNYLIHICLSDYVIRGLDYDAVRKQPVEFCHYIWMFYLRYPTAISKRQDCRRLDYGIPIKHIQTGEFIIRIFLICAMTKRWG